MKRLVMSLRCRLEHRTFGLIKGYVMKKHEKALLTSEMEMYDHIMKMNMSGVNVISVLYCGKIFDKLVPLIMKDMAECSGCEKWNDDDVRLSIGRVLCKKLNIQI